MLKHAARLMKSNDGNDTGQPGGAIINVASISGWIGQPGFGPYSASKVSDVAANRALPHIASCWITPNGYVHREPYCNCPNALPLTSANMASGDSGRSFPQAQTAQAILLVTHAWMITSL